MQDMAGDIPLNSGNGMLILSPMNAEEADFDVYYLEGDDLDIEKGIPITVEHALDIIMLNLPFDAGIIADYVCLYFTDEIYAMQKRKEMFYYLVDNMFNTFVWLGAFDYFVNMFMNRAHMPEELDKYIANFESHLREYIKTHRFQDLFYQGIVY